MILQRLIEYHDRIVAEKPRELPRYGWSLQKISFCVVINSDGSLNCFQSLQHTAGSRKVAREIAVPGQAKSSGSGMNPCFLWDNAAYMLGFKPEDPNPLRTAQRFAAFRKRHLDPRERMKSPQFDAVCRFLRSWSPEAAKDYERVLGEITQNFGVFRIAGEERFVHDHLSESEIAVALQAEEAHVAEAMCLATGEHGTIARLHEPKIKGVTGAQAAGALLVSFNAAAYESYGHGQSFNAPVSEAAVFKYATVLNHLLAERARRVMVGDATIIFWAERSDPLEEGFAAIFNDAPKQDGEEDEGRVIETRRFLSQLRQGAAISEALSPEGNRFFILGLSPNAARIAVRLWIDSDVRALKERLAQHLRDIELAGGSDEGVLTIRRIVEATGRAEKESNGRFRRFDIDSISPKLAGDIARAVLTGSVYPRSLLATMLRRIRMDGLVHSARVAAIKACLIRDSRLLGKPMEVSVKLDTNETDLGYNLGRLFAVLEKIQIDSLGANLNVTIKDRFFSSASTTPQAVLPRLIRLSQHHLAKLEIGARIFHERRLGQIMTRIAGFPKTMTTEAQGKFVIGYYHQRQDFYTKKTNEQGASA